MVRNDLKSEHVISLLLLLGQPQSTPCGFLSLANPVIHHYRQAVSGDLGVHLKQIDKCVSPSSDTHFAMLRFPQNQIANNFIFTPPAMTTESRAPLSKCGQAPKLFHNIHCSFLLVFVLFVFVVGFVCKNLNHFQVIFFCPLRNLCLIVERLLGHSVDLYNLK